jgi:AraC-like DNA-binding protein
MVPEMRGAEIFLVQLLRTHFEQASSALGGTAPDGTRGPSLMAAFFDPRLNAGLDFMRAHGHAPLTLTLAQVAAAAGLSRSTLAQRFKAVTGEMPMAYLAEWRNEAECDSASACTALRMLSAAASVSVSMSVSVARTAKRSPSLAGAVERIRMSCRTARSLSPQAGHACMERSPTFTERATPATSCGLFKLGVYPLISELEFTCTSTPPPSAVLPPP